MLLLEKAKKNYPCSKPLCHVPRKRKAFYYYGIYAWPMSLAKYSHLFLKIKNYLLFIN